MGNQSSNKKVKRGLMGSFGRNLGLFVGHVKQGIITPLESRAPREVGRTVQEYEMQSGGDRITLRRTVVDEVITDPAEQADQPASQ